MKTPKTKKEYANAIVDFLYMISKETDILLSLIWTAEYKGTMKRPYNEVYDNEEALVEGLLSMPLPHLKAYYQLAKMH